MRLILSSSSHLTPPCFSSHCSIYLESSLRALLCPEYLTVPVSHQKPLLLPSHCIGFSIHLTFPTSNESCIRRVLCPTALLDDASKRQILYLMCLTLPISRKNTMHTWLNTQLMMLKALTFHSLTSVCEVTSMCNVGHQVLRINRRLSIL